MHLRFVADVLKNQNNRAILNRWADLGLPDGWPVAGCLFQTVWNLQSGWAPEAHIKDYDLFYFDPEDVSELAEGRVQARVAKVLRDLNITINVKNRARVHLWYEAGFGHAYEPLASARDGIERFLVAEACVDLRPRELYTPKSLSRLYEGVLTENPKMPHQELFIVKAASYKMRWPWLSLANPQRAVV